MKNLLLFTVLIIFFFQTSLGYGSIKKTFMVRQDYKRALDAGADAATKHSTYVSEENLNGFSFGFGDGYENTNNIAVDKDDSLKWFYEIFYRDIGVEDSKAIRDSFKKYIPMKCIIEFDQISIADKDDTWVIRDKKFILNYNGKDYLFTLSNQIGDLETGVWLEDSDIGLNTKTREEMLAQFINEEIEMFLSQHNNMDGKFKVKLALSDADPKVNMIKGSNFIVFVEGLPIPSLNNFTPIQELHAFSIGGSQITRKDKY